jgi:hypothetical protein
MGTQDRGEIGSCFSACRKLAVLAVTLTALATGCKGHTVWSSESKSPDGEWTASARTVAHGGFPGGYDETFVFLKRTSGSEPQEIVEVSNGSYVLPGGKGAGMKWLTPTHLEVTYSQATVVFQAIKYWEVEISTKDISNEQIK